MDGHYFWLIHPLSSRQLQQCTRKLTQTTNRNDTISRVRVAFKHVRIFWWFKYCCCCYSVFFLFNKWLSMLNTHEIIVVVWQGKMLVCSGFISVDIREKPLLRVSLITYTTSVCDSPWVLWIITDLFRCTLYVVKWTIVSRTLSDQL